MQTNLLMGFVAVDKNDIPYWNTFRASADGVIMEMREKYPLIEQWRIVKLWEVKTLEGDE